MTSGLYIFAAGQAGSGAGTRTLNVLDFAIDTTNCRSNANVLTIQRVSFQVIDNGNGSAWIAGGYVAGNVATTERFEKAIDTQVCVAKGNLTAARRDLGGGSSQSMGYFAGGSVGTSLIDSLAFAIDTAAAVAKGSMTAGSEPNAGCCVSL